MIAEYKRAGIRFFKEPITVLVDEIRAIRENNKKTYCAIGVLIIFNNDFCVESLIENDLSENKFKKVLKGCGLKKTAPFEIGDILESLTGFFTKKIDNSYQFYHDFVMEVTTEVFGSVYPRLIIKYAE